MRRACLRQLKKNLVLGFERYRNTWVNKPALK